MTAWQRKQRHLRRFAHQIRRELVNRPFPRVNYYPGKTWAGCLIHERVATQGQRSWAHSTPWDEEWFAKFEEGK